MSSAGGAVVGWNSASRLAAVALLTAVAFGGVLATPRTAGAQAAAGLPHSIAVNAPASVASLSEMVATVVVRDYRGTRVGAVPLRVDQIAGGGEVMHSPTMTMNGVATFIYLAPSSGAAIFHITAGMGAEQVTESLFITIGGKRDGDPGDEPAEPDADDACLSDEPGEPDMGDGDDPAEPGESDECPSDEPAEPDMDDCPDDGDMGDGDAPAEPGEIDRDDPLEPGMEDCAFVSAARTWNRAPSAAVPLLVWLGADRASPSAGAVEGVVAIWRRTAAGWIGYFPAAPEMGALRSLRQGEAYWVVAR